LTGAYQQPKPGWLYAFWGFDCILSFDSSYNDCVCSQHDKQHFDHNRLSLQAYAAGLTFALAASPCSTPVLATLLAYVSTAHRPLEGGALLLAYTTG